MSWLPKLAAVAVTSIVATSAPSVAVPGAPTPLTESAPVTSSGPAGGERELLAARRTFPVRGATSYSSAHHDYPATDIFADCGDPVVSPVAGTVIEVSRVDRWDAALDQPRHRSGKFVSVVSLDGVRYYGSHLRSLARRVRPGVFVRPGQLVGRVGQTGNAAATPCHLHFGLSPICRGRGDWWIRRGVVPPYRFLRSWEDGGDQNPRRAVERWSRHHHRCGR